MSVDPSYLRHARDVADAVLYEGYLLYPYRASAQKNQARFQFGVLMPSAYRAVDGNEMGATQTECLLDCPDDAQVQVLARFLHLQRRSTEHLSPTEAGTGGDTGGDNGSDNGAATAADDAELPDGTAPWDEAIEREQEATVSVAALLAARRDIAFHVSGGQTTRPRTDAGGQVTGWVLREWAALRGSISLSATRVAGPYGALRLRVRLENHTHVEGPLRTRHDGLRYAMIAAHLLIVVPGARFHSMVDPPEWAAAEVSACTNIGTWPVLAGPEGCTELMLSSPVILYDHPGIAAESAGQLYDGTEIEEILTLRTLALTEGEQREVRATDARAASLLDRVTDMPPEMIERMHGVIRYLRSVPSQVSIQVPDPVPGVADEPVPVASAPAVSAPGASGRVPPGLAPLGMPGPGPVGSGLAGSGLAGPAVPMAGGGRTPWWDPGADESVSPETDSVMVAGVRLARGSRVQMRPGSRRADAQDIFLIGRPAIVEAVLHDVDGHVHLAVSPEDDPAAELNRLHGRYLYFAPDELVPIDQASPAAPETAPEPPEQISPANLANRINRPTREGGTR